jgi:hypothetical protein
MSVIALNFSFLPSNNQPVSLIACIRDSAFLRYNGEVVKIQDVRSGDLLLGDDNTPRFVHSVTKQNHPVQEKLYSINNQHQIVTGQHILLLKLRTPFFHHLVPIHTNTPSISFVLHWCENHRLISRIFFDEPSMRNMMNELIASKRANVMGDICEMSIDNYLQMSSKWKSLYYGFYVDRIDCWISKPIFFHPWTLGYHWNLYYNSLDNKPLLEEYKINTVEIRLQVLAGILDAHAFITTLQNDQHTPWYKFTHTNQAFYEDTIFIARSLGYTIRKKHFSIHFEDAVKYYYVHIGGPHLSDIPCRIKILSLPPSYHCNANANHIMSLYPITITPIEEKVRRGEDVNNILYELKIDRNNRVVTADFTVWGEERKKKQDEIKHIKKHLSKPRSQ